VTQINSEEDLAVATVAQQVLATLQPGYKEMKRDVLVAIAVFKDDKAEIGEQPIGKETRLLVGCPRLHPTRALVLDRFYTAERCAALSDRGITRAEVLVPIARQIIADGIAQEEKLVASNKRECGGPVDVMLVDEDSARFV